jgi:hypothetical protein
LNSSNKKNEKRKMRKRLLCLSILLALVLALSMFIGCLSSKTEEKPIEEKLKEEPEYMPWPSHGVHWKWYESEEGKFKVMLPSDWKIDEESEVPNVLGVTVEHEWELDWGRGHLLLGISCMDEKENSAYQGMSLYELAKEDMEYDTEFEKNMYKENYNFKLIEISNTTLAGKPAVKTVLEREYQNYCGGIDFSYEREIMILSRSDGIIYFIYFSPATMPSQEGNNKYWTYEKCLPIFEEMINSFEFL